MDDWLDSVDAWLTHMLTDSVQENGWTLALLLVLLLAAVMPLVVMWRRDRRMFRKKKETKMDRPETDFEPHTGVDLGEAQPLPAVADHRQAAQIDAEQERRWAREGIVTAEPVTVVLQEVPISQTPFGRSFGAAAVPTSLVSPTRIDCEHCQGRGYVPGINDLLQESIALLGDAGDEVVRTFYVDLFRRDPDLVALFPGNPTEGDFGTDHKGAKQREKLLDALAALAKLYDPGNPESMQHLDQALARFGRTHAAFVRKDGTIKGATWEEYAAVKDALFTTLVRAAGEHWRAEYTEAWSQAYDYAAAVMLVEQYRSGFSAPRFPRA